MLIGSAILPLGSGALVLALVTTSVVLFVVRGLLPHPAGAPGSIRAVSGPLVVLTAVAAVGCGLVGGVFFAFSSFVLAALARLAPAEGVAAMQSVNRLAVTPAFMTALFGTALACAALVVSGVVRRGEPGAPWALAGGALYLVGTIGVTVAGNVPLNDRLAGLTPDAAGTAGAWAGYVRRWGRLNHVRTGTALAAAALLVVALRVG